MPLDLTKLPYGWFSEEDCRRLYKAAQCAPPAGAFVEIGVYRGKSASVLQQADPQRELWLFDNCADCGVQPSSWPKGPHVHAFDRVVTPADLLDIGPIALLHHDGDHHASAITSDLTLISPSIMVGGFIVIHDWEQPNHDGNEVRRGWEEWPGHVDFRQCFACREQAAFMRVK